MKKLLFVSWDGPQGNYMEGLFFPILYGLKDQCDIHVVHFTWGEAPTHVRALLQAAGINYSTIGVRRKPHVGAGALWTMLAGMRRLAAYIDRHDIDGGMFRSTFPALMARGLRKRGRG